MEKEFNYTEIENYVKGEMSASNRQTFEQQLQEDTELAAEVRFYEEVAQVSELQGLFEEADEEIKAEQHNESKIVSIKSTRTRRINPVRRFMLMAASFAVLVLAGVFLWNNMNTSGQDHFAQYYQPYPNDIAPLTKGDNTPETTLEQALQAYERQNYQEARTLFSALPSTDTVLFYSSIIDLEEGKIDNAVSNLNNISQSESTFQQAADWYLALTYLKDGEKNNAKTVLGKIVANDRHFFKRQAEELLGKL